MELCKEHNVPLIEDAAESQELYIKAGIQVPLEIMAFSFNGNKIIHFWWGYAGK